MQQGECCILLHISQKQRGDSSASYRHEFERRSVPNSRPGPSWMLASPRGFRCRKGRRQRRPDWTTWRQWVLPEGVSCRTVGFVGHHCISPTVRKQWKPGSCRLTSRHQIWLNCSVRLVLMSDVIKQTKFVRFQWWWIQVCALQLGNNSFRGDTAKTSTSLFTVPSSSCVFCDFPTDRFAVKRPAWW